MVEDAAAALVDVDWELLQQGHTRLHSLGAAEQWSDVRQHKCLILEL